MNTDYNSDFTANCARSQSKRMKQELINLKNKKDYRLSQSEIDDFYRLFDRYVNTKEFLIDWDLIEPPNKDEMVKYDNLDAPSAEKIKKLANKLAVLKLNGGLGTTMGCKGPKSAIQVRKGKNFIDLIIKQINHLNKKYEASVPLVLMNSFNTDEVTQKIIYKFEKVRTFSQSTYPRVSADTLLPICDDIGDSAFYPPGHGDLYHSIERTGMLDELLAEGKEYLFISNIDNLAATVDFKILDYIVENGIDFAMEVTDKTRADIKGGTLIKYKDSLKLMEIAQVPADKKSEFTNARKFQVFNTNSAWISLKALKERLKKGSIDLDIIENKKIEPKTGEHVIQLETAIGAAIMFFPNSKGIVVPRSRFLPVKTCSDLFLVESNLYLEDHGSLKLNPKRIYSTSPLIKLLGKNFSKLESFSSSFKSIPDILELDHLTVSGNVKFGKNVVLKGTVIIIADEKSSITIPDGSILENNILYGNLPIIEH